MQTLRQPNPIRSCLQGFAAARSTRVNRQGLTLVEMLVVVAITLIFMFALTQVFALLGDGINSGRELIELNGQMRAITHRLQRDLDSITVPIIPWETLQNGGGYFESIEGLATDKDVNANGTPDVDEWDNDPANGIHDPSEMLFDTRLGDHDDIIMFTARSYDVPFVGKFVINNADTPEVVMIESHLAEIIWWTQFTPEFDDINRNNVFDLGETKTLYRRVLLISPILSNRAIGVGVIKPDLSQAALTDKNEFVSGTADITGSDISVRIENGSLVMNTLADVIKRENRVARNLSAFPYAFDPTLIRPLRGARRGDDVMLTRVLAFDVRVFDPMAPLVAVNGTVLAPSDPDWDPNEPVVSRGTYVDLNYAGNEAVANYQGFSGPTHFKSGSLIRPTYCTWSFHYEHDGLNQDGTLDADQGTNGVDDDNMNGVDDPGERETSPPYPIPLRGMQVKIRVYEPDSQTVRQATVTSSFSQ